MSSRAGTGTMALPSEVQELMDKLRPVVCGFLAALQAAGAELPVRQVTLFKHGVGYFERAGDVPAGETARLDFKASEMNDVLKSLVVREASGTRVSGLRYDSSEPLERRLSEYPFSLQGDVMPLAAFLNQLKGSAVEVVLGNEVLRGTIVSARYVPGEERRPEREYLVLMMDSGELRTVDLGAASAVRFPDTTLQAQLRDYLRVVAGARSREKRAVYIDSPGDRGRQLSVSYMIPAPVWKSSYRLLLKDAEPVLEGWAIVDNTTGEDWTKVNLSLVSGRPISFISRLYEPKYVARQTAELPEDRAQGPVLHEGGVVGGIAGDVAGNAGPRAEAVQQRAARSALPANAAPSAAPKMMEYRADVSAVEESSVMPALQASETGELFEYRFNEPVVVKKGESAMIPFLQQKIGARKLLIYTRANPLHPMNAAEIGNDTGKTLDGGPITVFDGGTYAGEGLIETLKAGDQRLISYGVDLGTRVTMKLDSGAAVTREVRAKPGVLTVRSAVRETNTYTARNIDAKPKTMLIEHPVRVRYKLMDVKPVETSANYHRFEMKIPAKGEAKFAVVEEREFENTVMAVNLTPDLLLAYVQNRAISEEGRKQLENIMAIKRQIAAADVEIRRLSTQIDMIVQDQNRLRQNINSLNNVAGQQEQVRTYAQALAGQEGQLVSLRDARSQTEQKRAAAQQELSSAVETLRF